MYPHKVFLTDTSTNGTLVNNRRITRCPLRNGDLLTFGLSTFEFRG